MQAWAERGVVDAAVGRAYEARLRGGAVDRAGHAFPGVERFRQREAEGAGAEHRARLGVAESHSESQRSVARRRSAACRERGENEGGSEPRRAWYVPRLAVVTSAILPPPLDWRRDGRTLTALCAQ